MITERISASSRLGSALRIRAVTLPNRIVGAPMERNYCDLHGRVTRRYVDYLARRAAGGAGLLFTESCYVTPAAKARPYQMGLHADHVIDPLRRLADAVHAEGGLVGVELNHAGRVAPSAVSQVQPVAPSAVACVEIGGELPRALTVGEIDAIVEAFGAAAIRALHAGVDVVSIHAAHGYLIDQFLSPRSNHRADAYGQPATFANRVIRAVRAAVGPQIPVFLRLSAFEGLPGGVDEDLALAHADALDLGQVDVIDLSAGTYGAGQWITPSGEVAEGYLADTARRYRRFGRLVGVAGRITTAAAAERVLSGAADLVCIGRALHADPDWARQAIAGMEPRPCISCNQGCADVIHSGRPIWCAVNPETGREGAGRVPASADVGGRRLLVVGAGPAGLEAAVAGARYGLRIRLVERSGELGGQLAVASRLRSKPQFVRLIAWYQTELQRLSVEALTRIPGISPDLVDDADAIVLATGGTGYVPPVPGSDHERVIDVRDWLRTQSRPAVPDVIVWGADRAGVYVADDLVGRGHRVTVIGPQPELAPDAGARERLPTVERLRSSSAVAMHLGVGVELIADDAITCSRDGERFTVQGAGPVLASHGVVPMSVTELPELDGLDATIVPVGDAAGGSTIDHAISSGREAVEQIVAALAGGTAAAVVTEPA